MTDYTKSTGSTATMMIRDTGTYVEFWLTNGNGSSFNHALPWGYTINGVTSGTQYFDFSSSNGYKRLGRWNVTTDQTVTFRLYDSGTSGIGGPTTFSVFINRTSAPPTPPPWVIEVIEDTRVRGDTDGYGTGGLAIDAIQVRYDNNSNASSPQYYNVNGTGYGWVEGLARGTTYYFWVRTHNAKGWSPWSARTSAKTHNFPPAPGSPVLSEIKQSSVKAVFSGNGDGGSTILEWQIAYGTDPTTPQLTYSGYNTTLINLSPGAIYYFWSRGRNRYGWGSYSVRATATLLAGAWVDVDGVKKRAVPYVKVNGVWQPAESWAKIAGMWKVTG